ncbi:hypothetical protein Taro_049065 [Colocasia esculenta]|uniref:Uncharacterized protein n=1 Tax=Colocasia esculenta TaxID=4460 RepID=A0A843X9W7_COLES|nr:hypothetical protein [Colocasia esculenta]
MASSVLPAMVVCIFSRHHSNAKPLNWRLQSQKLLHLHHWFFCYQYWWWWWHRCCKRHLYSWRDWSYRYNLSIPRWHCNRWYRRLLIHSRLNIQAQEPGAYPEVQLRKINKLTTLHCWSCYYTAGGTDLAPLRRGSELDDGRETSSSLSPVGVGNTLKPPESLGSQRTLREFPRELHHATAFPRAIRQCHTSHDPPTSLLYLLEALETQGHEAEARENENQVKSLLSGDPITCRILRLASTPLPPKTTATTNVHILCR